MEEDLEIPRVEEMNEDFDLPEDKVGEERAIGDSGLKKKLLKEGQGWDTPEIGDEVHGKNDHNHPVVFHSLGLFFIFFFIFYFFGSSLYGDFAWWD